MHFLTFLLQFCTFYEEKIDVCSKNCFEMLLKNLGTFPFQVKVLNREYIKYSRQHSNIKYKNHSLSFFIACVFFLSKASYEFKNVSTSPFSILTFVFMISQQNKNYTIIHFHNFLIKNFNSKIENVAFSKNYLPVLRHIRVKLINFFSNFLLNMGILTLNA